MGDSFIDRRGRPHIVILDDRFNIVMSPANALSCTEVFRTTARRMVEAGANFEQIDVAGERYMLRVTPLTGSEGQRYAMLIERRGTRRPLLDAYERFGLSGREAEVLSLMIDGASNRTIAETLCITESTVDDHVRRVLAKVGVRRRGALLARVFGLAGEGGATPTE